MGLGPPHFYVPQQGSAVALSADGNTALIGGPGSVYDVGATWVFTRTNGVWQQEQVLIGRELGPYQGTSGSKGFNPTFWGNQGSAVALSADGNTALVGGPSDDNSDNTCKGTTWMFIRTNGVWRRGFGLIGGGTELLQVGASVALSSDAKCWFVVAPGNTGVPTVYGHPGADSGIANFYSAATCIALSGDGNTVIFGVPGTAVYVYAYDAGQNVWAQQAVLTEPGSGSFGSSVALSADGNTAVIGDPSSNNNNGAVYLYTRYPGAPPSWTFQQALFDPAGAVGAHQGASVALSADGIGVLWGGPGDSNGTGAAWAFWRGRPRGAMNMQKIVGTGRVGDAQTPIRQGFAVALSADGLTTSANLLARAEARRIAANIAKLTAPVRKWTGNDHPRSQVSCPRSPAGLRRAGLSLAADPQQGA